MRRRRIEFDDQPRSTVRPAFTVSVRVVLVLLAAVPIAGTAWFAGGEFQRTSTARRHSEEVRSLADQYVRVTRLRTAVLDERSWALVHLGLGHLGLSDELVAAVSGIDPRSELAESRSAVDAQLAKVSGQPSRALASLRSSVQSIESVGSGYLTVERELGAQSEELLRQLQSLGGDIGNASALVESLRLLELATTARQSMTAQLTTYFAVLFASSDRQDDATHLVVQQVAYDEAIESLRKTDRTPRVVAILDQLEDADDVATFREAIDHLVDTLLRGELSPVELTPSAVIADMDDLAKVFTSGARASDDHLELIDLAAQQVRDASGGISAQAYAATRSAVVLLGLLSVASAGMAILVSRLVVTPLVRCAEQARRLRDGNVSDGLPLTGPREVREVAAALNEAGANVALAENQARALSRGDLSDRSLRAAVPGRLGRSLQEAVATLARSLEDREQFRSQLTYQADHDALTGVANRNASLRELRARLSRVRDVGTALAVMFVDLDGFKQVNDGHGHQTGDSVLQVVADRIREAIREGDHLGRLGGDEFLVIAEPVDSVSDAIDIAHRVRRALTRPIEQGGHWFRVDASIGVALSDHPARLTADELLRDSDLAVYKAKRAGRGRIEFCDDVLRAEQHRHVTMERDLRSSIRSDRLTMHYQPIVDADANVVALEALVRWRRPGHGLVLPSDFIPYAERSDLIVDIDNWVIQRVACQIAEWNANPHLRQVPIAVNLSGRHLTTEHVVADVLGPVRRWNVPTDRLILEVTEGALLDMPIAMETVTSFRAVGLLMALDDFGTGYTSLNHLRVLPIDILKIDRSLVVDRGAETLVRLVVDAGHHIGAAVTAEGVETHEQANAMIRIGCDRLQGKLFGTAVPPQEAEIRYLQADPPRIVQRSSP